jgi:hypothetical protein
MDELREAPAHTDNPFLVKSWLDGYPSPSIHQVT